MSTLRTDTLQTTDSSYSIDVKDLTKASAKSVLSVKDFGAKGDGVTDDYAAIQAALNQAQLTFSGVDLGNGQYRVSSGLVVPAGVTFFTQSSGEGYNGVAVVGGGEIIADLSVPVVVTLNGGSASASCSIKGIFVGRAAGTIPAGSIGIKCLSTDNCFFEETVSTRHSIAYSVEGQLAITLQGCNSFAITDTHLQLKNVVEVAVINSRFGRNGGADLSANSYVRITGAVDTVSFVRTQFNQSGQNVAGPILDLVSYNSPNGIITLSACHAEAFTGALIRQTGVGSSALQRLTVSSSQIHSEGGATQELLQALTSGLTELNLIGNSSIVGKLSLDQQPKFSVVGNFIHGDVLVNQGSGVVSDNRLLSNLTVQGAFPDGVDHCAVVSGNALVSSGVFTNTATGNINCYGNIQGTALGNSDIVNSLGGGYLKMSDVSFAVKRFTGTLGSDGTVTVALGGLNTKVLSVSAYYRGTSGEALPMTLAFVDGSNVRLTGGTANAKYRLGLTHSKDVDSNW